MARELDININVVDDGAKEKLSAIDASADQLTKQVERTRGEVAALESGFRSLGQMLGQDQAKLAAMEAPLASTATASSSLSTAQTQAAGGAKELAAQTDTGTESMSKMDVMAQRLVMRMALLFALKGSFQFVEGLFTAAEATANLATNLDVSTTKVQEWEFASKQTGISMGVLTGAADTLGKKIAGGANSVTYALQQLGLDTDQYFSADPGERFDQTAAAIAQMGDKTARTGVEMALFGTDKIDPLIMRLKSLEDEAHKVGVILSEEDTKALDQAAKSLEMTTSWLKVTAAGWLVAAQNAVAYYVAARGGSLPEQEGLDVQPLMPLPSGPPKNAGGMGSPGQQGLAPLDPSKKADLAAIAALEREITKEVEIQISAENKQLAFEKDMFRERELLYKKIQAEMLKTSEMYLKVTNDAVVAELAAKERINAAQGLDLHGNPLSQANNPFTVASKAQHDLDVSAATSPGVSTAARQQEINDAFLKAIMADAQAADGEARARNDATASAVKLSSAHAGAVQVSGTLAGAFGSAASAAGSFITQLSMKTNNPQDPAYFGTNTQGSVARTLYAGGAGGYTATEAATIAGGGFINFAASGGGVPHFAEGGYAANPMHAVVGDSPGGEYMVPAQQMDKLTSGGGIGAISITVQGNVDSRATADRLAAQTADLVFQKIRGQRKVQLGKG